MPIFDWSPTSTPSAIDNTAQDTMASQSFLNMLTQDADADLQMLTQLDATPSSGGKGAPKGRRGGNYNHNEDQQIILSWMDTTNDPIKGTDQSEKTYWERIAENCHANRDLDSDRTPNSLEHRCMGIIKECMLFQGYYDDAMRRHPSDVMHQELMKEADVVYTKKTKGKGFSFLNCWLIAKHSEKFASLEHLSRKSRESNRSVGSHLEDGGEAQESSSVPPTKKAQPPVRKQSKEKLKNNEGDDEYKDMMQNLLVIKTKEHKLRKAKWDKDVRLKQRRLEIEEEQKIMFCDLSTMDEHQRAYVLAKRAEFAKKASLRSSGGGGSTSVGDAIDSSHA